MHWIKRIFVGLIFAIPLMLVAYSFTRVQAAPEPPQAQASDGSLNCIACHQASVDAWQNGAHGHATNDPIFNKSWIDQGKPQSCLKCHTTGYDEKTGTYEAQGVTCIACHNPIPENHPLEPMATDRSGDTCGNCHNETFFEWQISAHRDKGVDCAGCHDPHSTSLKADTSEALCASCHRGRASNFTHSKHSEQGLACADCHLNQLPTDGQEGHARRDHSFFVSLTACNSCHAYQMHDPVEVHPEQLATPVPVDAMASVEASVAPEPNPVSPIGYTVLAGLVGIAVGIVVAPAFDRIQRRKRHIDNDKEG